MEAHHSDPEQRLKRTELEAAAHQRGKLKIFFGAAPGVGKTYSMLDAAQLRHGENVDVVIGCIDSHAQPETQGLIAGLEIIPPQVVQYGATQLVEFDLDAALARRPDLILIDELAHSNAPGLRHTKRWQDVEELLQAGIDVYTTVNVQHLDSLRDVVYQITGLMVRETIPDSILDQADEVELIDLSPDDLLQRLREGSIYLPDQAEYLARDYFRRGNLMALRELALRRTADRVDQQMQTYRHEHAVLRTWPAAERILVCISSSSLSARLVRAAKRMAVSLHAEWLAVYVEKPERLNTANREQAFQTLREAEQLGAQTTILQGRDVIEEILAYARRRNVSKIIVGKPVHPRWRDTLFGSLHNDLIRASGDIDVYVISGDPEEPGSTSPPMFQRTSTWWAYAQATLIVALCTALSWLMFPYFAHPSLIMFYLVGVVVAAARYGRGPSILASVLSVAAFDFFFVAPYLTFAVSDPQYVLTFAVMLVVAITISNLTVRIKQQAETSREREWRTASLYAMSRELANSRTIENLADVITRHISDVFDCQTAAFLPDKTGQLQLCAITDKTLALDQPELGTALWVYQHGLTAGLGTDTLPGAKGLYLPLLYSRGAAGVVGVYPAQPDRLLAPDQLHLLETFVNQSALAIERTHLADEAEQARMQIETERLRNSLLSSVSHDLRTPLAVITGAVSSLLEKTQALEPDVRHELAQVAYEESERLNRLVGNLLEMTRLELGGIHVHKEWQPLEEVVGAALNRLEGRLRNHPVTAHLPDDLPAIPLDSVLIEQVLVNLLENAVKYTPAGCPIELSALAQDNKICIMMADRGPGLPPGEEQRVFEKFYRAQPNVAGGVGLGLTVCRGIVEAHGGHIWAENRAGGGAVFCFTLPLDGGLPPEGGLRNE